MTVPLKSMAMDKPEWLTSMEAVLEVLNEGVLIINEHQQILSVNSRFIEMTGISRQDLSGSYASQFYSPQEWDFIARQISVGFQHGHNRYVFVLPRKDGGRVPVIISSRALVNSGRQFGIVTFTDISEQVRTAEELRSANAKLQQRQMEIEICGSPHESRTVSHPDPWSGAPRASTPSIRIVLYTDGITEVFNSRGEMLGIEGVREIVRQTSSLPPHEMKQGILDGVAAWREGPPTDDVSLMLVHVR